jgi:uncharacterized protein
MSAQTPKCPTCRIDVLLSGETAVHRPFCSLRCKMVDLDRWFSGDYRIPGHELDPEDPRLAGRPPGGDDTDPDSGIRDD